MNTTNHIRRKDVVCSSVLIDTVVWSTTEGAHVDAGQVLGTVGALESGNQQRIIARCRGSLRILAKDIVVGATTTSNGHHQNGESNGENTIGSSATTIIAYIEYCIHPLMNGRTCMMCLAIVDENEEELDEDQRSVNIVSHGQVLRLNVEEAKKFDSANIQRQLTAKKLSLVLDLDHTLLHAVRVEDVVGSIPPSDDIHFFYIPGLYQQQHVVKLRPGLIPFLQELSSIYDLFIYTHGTRMYAETIATIIDPNHTFFQHRIVARTDTPELQHKSLKLLFPSSDDTMILVLDDRIDVWKENEGNVFLIEPYHYFTCRSEINNASGRGVLGMEDSEVDREKDRQLEHAMRVLKHVHQAFYDEGTTGVAAEAQMAGDGRDVKAILLQHKKTILQGCHLVFSGLFPIHGDRPLESHYLWRLAIELGAIPSITMDQFPITHLVIHPIRLRSEKHLQAKNRTDVCVVVPEWMLKSARIWKRANEAEFNADEWHAKQLAAKAAVAVAAEVVETPRPLSAIDGSSVDTSEEDISSSATPAPVQDENEPNEEEKTEEDAVLPLPASTKQPDSILVSDAQERKPKQAVKFAAEVDIAEQERAEQTAATAAVALEQREREQAPGGLLSSGGAPQRRPIRRGIGGRRNGSAMVGTVASGGTFDFLSKISQLGATKRQIPSTTLSLSSVATVLSKASEKPKATVEKTKDMDDAFLRLMEAEEAENELESKRKRSSGNLRDELASRRMNREKSSRVVSGSGSIPTEPPSKLRRVELEVRPLEEEEEDEEEDLDDLEADILNDL